MNVISAVNPQGKFRFMCVKGRVNAGVFIDVLKRMIESTERKVFLIVDGRPSHKATELNPDEYVWNDLKNNSLGCKALTSIEEMKREVISYLRFIQKTPERVRSFFNAPTTVYAAMY